MDCRDFKEMLDSYLCEELAVETNHAILRHAEHCGPCRGEMSARRELRARLRRACSRERMSEEAAARLRERLRCEAQAGCEAGWGARWRERIAKLFVVSMGPMRLAVAAAGLLLFLAGAWVFTARLRGGQVSAALLAQAIGDHRTCGQVHAGDLGDVRMPDSAVEVDPAYGGLERIAAPAADGLQLRAAHVCDFEGRSFAHLVYTRGARVLSLLVTERDVKSPARTAAMQTTPFDGLLVGACQTGKRVVLVVSDPDDRENAARLAMPVAEYLRGLEAGVSVKRAELDRLIALKLRE
ncbi:MAG: hypothetical protein SF339_27870 [Blastocatellia bacterium]|nr:hypothetical protein [Blastocatellia bacterium]